MLRRLSARAAGLVAARRPQGSRPFSSGRSCLADRETRKLTLRDGHSIHIEDEDFWKYVADQQSIDDADVYQNNVENYVGTVKYPVGLIGPVRVHGEYTAGKEYVIPMASHEGALLASYSRGAKVLNESGGVTARIKGRRMLRAPVFGFPRIADATDFLRFLSAKETQRQLRARIEGNLAHCTVVGLKAHQTDRKVHLQIAVDSDDAAGQNIVTYAGTLAMELVKELYGKPIYYSYIEGGFNSGKRVSAIHLLEGKGHSVVADAIVPKAVVQQMLHTTPYRLQRFQKMHNRTNEFVGGLSCTGHAANGLAAMFIALGQDPACVAECQVGVTHFDLYVEDSGTPIKESDLYCSITLNSVIVATVGGGTSLPAFKAARALTGVQSANELAEVCAAAILGGELSFYAAMESGEFAKAHWNLTHKK
mmetsp:Transcript_9743/g.21423  ORF Transcript_9743/g.21423 Transcript_9743/m.21423 type:complete len:422 (+) Transcript_9743:324-1589(+)